MPRLCGKFLSERGQKRQNLFVCHNVRRLQEKNVLLTARKEPPLCQRVMNTLAGRRIPQNDRRREAAASACEHVLVCFQRREPFL